MTDELEELIRRYSLADPRRAAGGLRTLSGFRYQLLAHLAQFVKEVIDRITLLRTISLDCQNSCQNSCRISAVAIVGHVRSYSPRQR